VDNRNKEERERTRKEKGLGKRRDLKKNSL
jgi:hypothetical protein